MVMQRCELGKTPVAAIIFFFFFFVSSRNQEEGDAKFGTELYFSVKMDSHSENELATLHFRRFLLELL